jgi:hypothetical protein
MQSNQDVHVYEIWGIYMVANLILLYSLKTYPSFGTWKTTLHENMGYLIHPFFSFQAGIGVPIVLNISNTCLFF